MDAYVDKSVPMTRPRVTRAFRSEPFNVLWRIKVNETDPTAFWAVSTTRRRVTRPTITCGARRTLPGACAGSSSRSSPARNGPRSKEADCGHFGRGAREDFGQRTEPRASALPRSLVGNGRQPVRHRHPDVGACRFLSPAIRQRPANSVVRCPAFHLLSVGNR
jgi:hypothetical protein